MRGVEEVGNDPNMATIALLPATVPEAYVQELRDRGALPARLAPPSVLPPAHAVMGPSRPAAENNGSTPLQMPIPPAKVPSNSVKVCLERGLGFVC